MKNSIVFALCLTAANAFAAPCDGVNKQLSDAERAALAPAIETHLNKQLGPDMQKTIRTEPRDILAVIRFGNWHIVKVNSHINADSYLFYPANPLQSKAYTTIWAGAAAADEHEEVLQWESLHARGIPQELAGCFAWQVTQS